jgi:hypothetical protein
MMKRLLRLASVVLITLMFSFGCARTIYVRTAPPPPQVETKPPRPGAKAVWIDGHWKWAGKRYVWVSGHWEKNPKGKWVPGHWKRRGRGHVWVKGHWKR